MKRENALFLLTGLAFGMLFGFGLYHAVANRPAFDGGAAVAAGVDAPRGPQAPTQLGPNAAGGAPMVAEVNRLKRRLQEHPDEAETLLRLANLYHDAGMWEQAAGYYERARTARPDDPDLLTDLGVCYRNLQQNDRALDLFDEAYRLQPTHWQSLFNTVVVGVESGRFDLAERAMDSMEKMQPPPAGLDPTRLRQLREALEQARAAPEGSS